MQGFNTQNHQDMVAKEQSKKLVLFASSLLRHSPSFRIAMIKTIKGEKSNFQIRAMSMKPNCNIGKET